MATKPYANELAHLSKCVPKLVKGSGAPNKSFSEIVVRFEGANLEMYPQLLKCLEYYCWPTNTAKAGSVTNPAIDGGPQRGKFEGVWRFVSCDPTKSNRSEGVYLTLREGYAQKLAWDEARVPSRDIIPQTDNVPIEDGVTNTDEDYIDIIFPNCDPEKSQSIADALLALETVSSPTIWTHKYTATYHVLRSRVREENDGSHSVVGVLARPRCFVKTYENYNSHNAADVYYLHHVPKRIVQSIVDNGAYKTDGASCTLNYATERATYDVIIRTGVDDPITIVNKQTEDGCLTETYTDFYFGITKAAVDAITIGTPPNEAPKGYIYNITGISPAANGRFNVRVDRIKAIAKTGTKYTSEITKSSETKTQESKNQPSVITLGAAVQGIIKRVRNMMNRFCVYDAVKEEITSTEWGPIEFTIQGEDGDEDHIVYGNQRTIDIGDPGEGFYYRLAGWSRNEDGTYNWHLVKEKDIYDDETVLFWNYSTNSYRTLIIAEGAHAGWKQDQTDRLDWIYQSRRFKTEADGYTWLQGLASKSPNCGVNQNGKAKFHAYARRTIDSTGWTNTGSPYQP